MTLHISRDFFPRNYTGVVAEVELYFLAVFLRYVLGYTVVGQTNFNLNGAAITKGSGTAASMNFGYPDQFAVAIPSGQYTVSVSDVDRILVLASSSNPKKNSGLFRITGINTTNNWLYVNFSSPEYPVAESGTLRWAVVEKEDLFTFNTGGVLSPGNNSSFYQSQGIATCSRIILQSPAGWQVRLTRESANDSSSSPGFSNLPTSTVAPGYGGNSAGDFAAGGEHLHMYQFRNLGSSTSYRANMCSVTLTAFTMGGINRVYMWGDDETGSVVLASRHAGSQNTNWLAFGLCEQEDLPLPGRDAQRLFVIGYNSATSTVSNTRQIALTTDTFFSAQGGAGGSGFGLSRQPVSACFSLYAYLTGQSSSAAHPRFDAAANDNFFTLQTELLPVDVCVGTWDSLDTLTGNNILQLEARRLGVFPFARYGRVFSNFTITNDKNWIHLLNGVWLPWSGIQNLP